MIYFLTRSFNYLPLIRISKLFFLGVNGESDPICGVLEALSLVFIFIFILFFIFRKKNLRISNFVDFDLQDLCLRLYSLTFSSAMIKDHLPIKIFTFSPGVRFGMANHDYVCFSKVNSHKTNYQWWWLWCVRTCWWLVVCELCLKLNTYF